jgi:hypothetical protein
MNNDNNIQSTYYSGLAKYIKEESIAGVCHNPFSVPYLCQT